MPAILLVGTFEPFDEREAEASGADAHLKKPFDSQELIAPGRPPARSGRGRRAGAPPGQAPSRPPPPRPPRSGRTSPSRSTTRRGAPPTTEGEVFRLGPEPELELELEPALRLRGAPLRAASRRSSPSRGPPGCRRGTPGGGRLAVLPFVEEEGEPFRLGEDDLSGRGGDEDTVAESPFRRDAAAVTAEEALDRAHQQAPSAPLAEPAHVAGFAIETDEAAGRRRRRAGAAGGRRGAASARCPTPTSSGSPGGSPRWSASGWCARWPGRSSPTSPRW